MGLGFFFFFFFPKFKPKKKNVLFFAQCLEESCANFAAFFFFVRVQTLFWERFILTLLYWFTSITTEPKYSHKIRQNCMT